MVENKNRGAGLILVISALAVSMILLTSSLWLAHLHYKNALNKEISNDQLNELDLCAELVCVALNKDRNASDFHDVLSYFYASESVSSETVRTGNGTLSVYSFVEEEDHLLLVLRLENDVTQEARYSITKQDGSFVYRRNSVQTVEVTE